MESKSLGSVLVIGGCGFVGYHIVRQLIDQDLCTDIAVLSRNPNRNRLNGVSYHAGDIANPERIQAILDELNPRVVFNSAAPGAIQEMGRTGLHKTTTIDGTKNTLACSAEHPSVQAYIYTSSTSILEGIEHLNANETHPLLSANSRASDYAKAKALADILVLEANQRPNSDNTKTLKTVCIRPTGIYGERGAQTLEHMYETVRKGRTGVQMGDNKNLIDWVSAENVARAHTLAAKALVVSVNDTNAPRIDGEAFIITDGAPLPFWDFVRKVFRAAGDTSSFDKVRVIPAGLALWLVTIFEWIYWLATLGMREPRTFTRQKIQHSCLTHTYCIDKARERLGYVPVGDQDEEIKKAARWALEEQAREKEAAGKTKES